MIKMAHVAPYKKEIVKKISEMISEYPIVGLVDMESLPAPQLQTMREKLRGQVEIFMSKKRLMRLAFEDAEKAKPGISKLLDHMKGMPALLFTKENPFAIFKTLKKSQSAAPAKGGQTAPKDIEVKSGATSFNPGPIIGELGAFGIKTGVENGKVAIKTDTVVCKEGEVISPKLAEILGRLGIEPMSVGLDLVAIFEEGAVFKKDVLDIDEEAFKETLMTAASDAFKLAFEVGLPTPETMEPLLTKAASDAFALGVECAIPTKDTVDMLLSRAEMQANEVKRLTA